MGEIARFKGTTMRSPLKDKPLRNPGQGVDEQLQRVLDDESIPYFWFPAVLIVLAAVEWLAYLQDASRQPVLDTFVAAIAALVGAARLFQLRGKVKRLKLGRDGERLVGQFLEQLRVDGARIFHDVPGEGSNLDHVVISAHGLFVVETKTWSNEWSPHVTGLRVPMQQHDRCFGSVAGLQVVQLDAVDGCELTAYDLIGGCSRDDWECKQKSKSKAHSGTHCGLLLRTTELRTILQRGVG
jgi:Nuclease-related domain